MASNPSRRAPQLSNSAARSAPLAPLLHRDAIIHLSSTFDSSLPGHRRYESQREEYAGDAVSQQHVPVALISR